LSETKDDGTLRTFSTGATRDTGTDKLEPQGFLSPEVLHRFSQYMHKHRKQSDGSLRASDNWKKGMPQEEYVKSLLRHVMDLWAVLGGEGKPLYDAKESQGWLHEELKAKNDEEYRRVGFNIRNLWCVNCEDPPLPGEVLTYKDGFYFCAKHGPYPESAEQGGGA
jgi:hypothetical protein